MRAPRGGGYEREGEEEKAKEERRRGFHGEPLWKTNGVTQTSARCGWSFTTAERAESSIWATLRTRATYSGPGESSTTRVNGRTPPSTAHALSATRATRPSLATAVATAC